ncbi:MAG: hypothetical protein WAN92_03110 [Herbaspirillum sp.]
MTSFLRTRKDRHPKPENKTQLPRTHDPSGGSHAGREETAPRGNDGLDDITQESGTTPRETDRGPASR